MHAPTIMLSAAGAKDRAVGQLHGFIFHGAEQMPQRPLTELAAVAPCLAAVLGGQQHSPPRAGCGADFIKKHQRACLRLKEHGVPAGIILVLTLGAGGHLHRGGPAGIHQTRQTDADVIMLLACAGKPRGNKAGLGFDNRRGMTLRRGAILQRIDEGGGQ